MATQKPKINRTRAFVIVAIIMCIVTFTGYFWFKQQIIQKETEHIQVQIEIEQQEVLNDLSYRVNDIALLTSILTSDPAFGTENGISEHENKTITGLLEGIVNQQTDEAWLILTDDLGNVLLEAQSNAAKAIAEAPAPQENADAIDEKIKPQGTEENISEMWNDFNTIQNLTQGEIYVSNLDLSSNPDNPMIRFSTPLYTTAGDKVATITMGYNMKEVFVLDQKEALVRFNKLRIVDTNGQLFFDESTLTNDNTLEETTLEDSPYVYNKQRKTPFDWEVIDHQLYTSYFLSVDSINAVIKENIQSDNQVLFSTDGCYFVEEESLADIGNLSKLNYLALLFLGIGTFIVIELTKSIMVRRHNQKEKLLDLNEKVNQDTLTGLANRRALLIKMQEYQQEYREFTVLFMDLDNFKVINDTFGHDAGDQTLKIITKRLLLCVREDDMVCRLGGDEFVILLKDLRNKRVVERICETIIERTAQPITFEQHQKKVNVGISIGVRFSDPEKSPETLLETADGAMYDIKRNGKNNFCFFDPDDDITEPFNDYADRYRKGYRNKPPSKE